MVKLTDHGVFLVDGKVCDKAPISAAEARKKKNRLERLHRMAEALEQEIEQIDEALAGPDGTDYKKAAALDERKTHAEEELLAVYEELETLESEG